MGIRLLSLACSCQVSVSVRPARRSAAGCKYQGPGTPLPFVQSITNISPALHAPLGAACRACGHRNTRGPLTQGPRSVRRTRSRVDPLTGIRRCCADRVGEARYGYGSGPYVEQGLSAPSEKWPAPPADGVPRRRHCAASRRARCSLSLRHKGLWRRHCQQAASNDAGHCHL